MPERVNIVNEQSPNIDMGVPLPQGCHRCSKGINFSFNAPKAKKISLLLFDKERQQKLKIDLDPALNKTGSVWHLQINDSALCYYLYLIDEINYVLDPYALELDTGNTWGAEHNPIRKSGTSYFPLCVIPAADTFDWQGVRPPNLPLSSLCIYEMHLRGFTRDPSSQVKSPGTFLGLIEKIPYLKELGINAIELLPIFEFNENEYQHSMIDSHEKLYNYWGYSPVSFFALFSRYAVETTPGSVIKEFKTMVRELHRHGIEVILDVVYNHTAEGGADGPAYSYRAISPKAYYMHTPTGQYVNVTGCGNTVNANNPITKELIISSLRYWTIEFHIDGFRFDLASTFSRNALGEPIGHPPVIEAITNDPILTSVKLIAEPWDPGGLYQVGSFPLHKNRWSEWNDRYRDSVRRYIKGIPGSKREFSTRLCGSQDIFDHGRGPQHSINFITAHDGFSLNDLVSYNIKHNLSNGENDRDGLNNNESWNCGVEGETNDPIILNLRERQKRNFLISLLLSFGIPMLTMGDEYGHAKQGNNNTWCHDNELNWKRWNLNDKEKQLLRFTKLLLRFRQSKRLFARETFLTPKEITWHGKKPHQPEWNIDDHFVAYTLHDAENKQDIYCAFNMSKESVEATLPPGINWCSWINTSAQSPEDIFEDPLEHPWKQENVVVASHSVIVKIGKIIF